MYEIINGCSFFPLVQEARRKCECERERRQREADVECVMEQSSLPLSPDEVEQRTSQYTAERRKRIENFVEHVRTTRRTLLEQARPKT